MSNYLKASTLIGKMVIDQENKGIGKIISFLIDPFGQIENVLVQDSSGRSVEYPADMLKMEDDQVLLVSDFEKKLNLLYERLPILRRKRQVLEKLLENKVIPPMIYENLSKEFDKVLKDMKTEAKKIIDEMDSRVKKQEERVKKLQLARAFLEIEHDIGTVSDPVYQQSIMALLTEVKSVQQSKIRSLDLKEKVTSIMTEKKQKVEIEEESQSEKESGQGLKQELEQEIEQEEPSIEPETVPEPPLKKESGPVPVRLSQD